MKPMTLAIIIIRFMTACGPPCDNQATQCGGFLLEQTTSNDGRFRYCKYTDGFILTIKYFENCPLTD